MPTGANRWGTTLWGRSSSAAGSGAVLDVGAALLNIIYRLGLTDASEVTSTSWVTAAELYQLADDAVKHLAYEVGVFIQTDHTIAVTPGTAIYDLPAAHVFTLFAALEGSPLRLTTVRDLWALDATWQATSGPATRCSMDAGSVGTITIYPNPTGGGTLNQIVQEYPVVTQQASAIALPTVFQDYFSYAMLAGARGKESESAMPDVAPHFEERMRLYERIMNHLYGPGQ